MRTVVKSRGRGLSVATDRPRFLEKQMSAIEMLKEKIEESKKNTEEMERLFEQAFNEKAIKKADENLWDVKDVAAYLKCGESTVKQAYLSGKLPYRKVLGVIRFDPNVIRALDNKSS